MDAEAATAACHIDLVDELFHCQQPNHEQPSHQHQWQQQQPAEAVVAGTNSTPNV